MTDFLLAACAVAVMCAAAWKMEHASWAFLDRFKKERR